MVGIKKKDKTEEKKNYTRTPLPIWVNSSTPVSYDVPVPLVAIVVLRLLRTRRYVMHCRF